MKNIKAFTLVELILGLVILTVIGLAIALNIGKVFDKKVEDSYDDYVNKIISATDAYLNNNLELLTELNTNKSFIKVSIKDLIDSGLLKHNLKNPKTGENARSDELVMASLDEAGILKFRYPYEEMEEYLNTIDKRINYKEEFNCLDGLNTLNLGFVDKDGNLIKDYFKAELNNISCKTNSIDTSKIGSHKVVYSYILPNGITKEATRNYLVVDHILPEIINIKSNPTAWTKDNVLISADINDYESGIDSYSINLNKCDYIATDKTNISKTISQNGKYLICAKDKYGNTKEEILNITNIDKIKPTVKVSKSTNSYVTSLTINGVLTDNESKIVSYAINQISDESRVSWTNISPNATVSINQTITSNGTYYVWAKDLVGNVTKESILINNLGILKQSTVRTGELTSSSYNGVINAGSTVKAVISATSNTGRISSTSISGSSINYSLTGGSSYTGTDWKTCTYGASYRSATYNESCASYSCSSGGRLSGTRCTGRTYTGSGVNSYECRNESWVSTFNSNYVVCDSGYTKTYTCGSKPTGKCTNGSTRNVSCTGTCNWRGDYDARCTRYTGSYSCPSGYSLSGSSCYRCQSGDRLSGSTCSYSCQYSYTYYQYTITLEYLV